MNKLENSLWKWFSLFIRLRDCARNKGYGQCYTCGRIIHYKDGDCGHYEKRQHHNTKYDERNNHLQCKKCNRYEGGRQSDYAIHLQKDYGQNILKELSNLKWIPKTFTDKELTDKKEYYKNKAKELLKTCG